MSHTVEIKLELRDKEVLGQSVLKMEGNILGDGSHRLYAGQEQGWGFTLPKWKFPLVLKQGGELAFDSFRGLWGNEGDIERLKERYALETARGAATAQGWLSEEIGNCLVIYHPDGGTLTVAADGSVDANGFLGTACASASEAIEKALGTEQEEQLKDEYFAERASIRQIA